MLPSPRASATLVAPILVALVATSCVPRAQRATTAAPFVPRTGDATTAGIVGGVAAVATVVETLAGPSRSSTPTLTSPAPGANSFGVGIPPSPLEPGPERDGHGGYPCRTASGELDVIVAESPERAARTCEALGGEPCVCTVEAMADARDRGPAESATATGAAAVPP